MVVLSHCDIESVDTVGVGSASLDVVGDGIAPLWYCECGYCGCLYCATVVLQVWER